MVFLPRPPDDPATEGRRRFIGTVGALGFIAVLAVGPLLRHGQAHARGPALLQGSLTLTQPLASVGDGPCRGSGELSGLRAGAPVVLGAPGVLVRGVLSEGRASSATSCVFRFSLAHIPNAPSYTVQVAGRNDGVVTRDEITTAGFRVDLRVVATAH